MLTKFHSPSLNTFGLQALKESTLKCGFFPWCTHGFGQDKTSMSRKLTEIFVRHSASTKYLSCPQSSYPVEKISQYLCFSNFSIIFLTGFQFLSRRLYLISHLPLAITSPLFLFLKCFNCPFCFLQAL